MITIRITATRGHKSPTAGLSSCACSTPIAIRPDSWLEFLGTVTTQEIAVGHCLLVLSLGDMALQLESAGAPLLPGERWWSHVFPAHKDTEKLFRYGNSNQKPWWLKDLNQVVFHQSAKAATVSTFLTPCWWDLGSCTAWCWVKNLSHVFTT